MDAGVAAVVGAAIGGGLAALTAIGTSWFSLRVARLQLKSQETEAAQQRRFEGLRERREPRAKAYSDFVAGGQQIIDLMIRGHENLPGALLGQATEMAKLRAAVAIWGPQPVDDAAAEFVVACAMLMARVRREDPSATEQFLMSQDVATPLNEFIEAARAALEEDGTERQPAVSP